MFRKANDFLKGSYKYDPNKLEKNISGSYLFMMEIKSKLKKDEELVKLLQSCLKKKHYKDVGLHLLTSDFVYFLKVRSESKTRLKYKFPYIKKKKYTQKGAKNSKAVDKNKDKNKKFSGQKKPNTMKKDSTKQKSADTNKNEEKSNNPVNKDSKPENTTSS